MVYLLPMKPVVVWFPSEAIACADSISHIFVSLNNVCNIVRCSYVLHGVRMWRHTWGLKLPQ